MQFSSAIASSLAASNTGFSPSSSSFTPTPTTAPSSSLTVLAESPGTFSISEPFNLFASSDVYFAPSTYTTDAVSSVTLQPYPTNTESADVFTIIIPNTSITSSSTSTIIPSPVSVHRKKAALSSSKASEAVNIDPVNDNEEDNNGFKIPEKDLPTINEQAAQAPPEDHTGLDPDAQRFFEEFAIPEIMEWAATRDLTTEEVNSVCSSPDFEPNKNNWDKSGAHLFFTRYTFEYSEDPRFVKVGPLNHIAETYLREGQYSCDTTHPYECVQHVSCRDIVQNVRDRDLARKIYFIFLASHELAKVFETMTKGIEKAADNILAGVPQMVDQFSLSALNARQDDPLGKLLETTVEILSIIAVNIVTPLLDLGAPVLGSTVGIMAQQAITNRDLLANMLTSDPSKDNYRKWKVANGWAKFTQSAYIQNGAQGADEILGAFNWRPDGWVNWLAEKGAAFTLQETYSTGSDTSTADGKRLYVENFVRYTRDTATHALKFIAARALSQGFTDEFGLHPLGELIGRGNYLSPHGASKRFMQPDFVNILTKQYRLRTLNAIFKMQKIYITCTKDYRRTKHTHVAEDEHYDKMPKAESCRKDNVGPKDLKACVDDYVCYMYKWSDRGFHWAHGNEYPFGVEDLEEAPWNLKISDIIESSVRYAQQQSINAPSGILGAQGMIDMALDGARALEKSLDPKRPGMFTIPVCFSQYHWAANINGRDSKLWRAMQDARPPSPVKNLPCSCGLNGQDTERIWKELGFRDDSASWEYKYRKDYITGKYGFCSYQIRERMPDRLEKYVAWCRHSAHSQNRVTKMGKEPGCDSIVDIIDAYGLTIEALKNEKREVYFILRCRSGKMGTMKTKSRDKAFCEPYMHGSLEKMVGETDPSGPLGQEGRMSLPQEPFNFEQFSEPAYHPAQAEYFKMLEIADQASYQDWDGEPEWSKKDYGINLDPANVLNAPI